MLEVSEESPLLNQSNSSVILTQQDTALIPWEVIEMSIQPMGSTAIQNFQCGKYGREAFSGAGVTV